MRIYEVIETCDCEFYCDCGMTFHGKFLNGKNAENRLKEIKRSWKYDSFIYIHVEETQD